LAFQLSISLRDLHIFSHQHISIGALARFRFPFLVRVALSPSWLFSLAHFVLTVFFFFFYPELSWPMHTSFWDLPAPFFLGFLFPQPSSLFYSVTPFFSLLFFVVVSLPGQTEAA